MRKIGFIIPIFIFCITTVKSDYFDEYPSAYTRAFKNGITTQTTIDKADMYGDITRIALSKMISNYAINVLNKKPDTTKKCEFTDISDKLNKQYDSGVTKACQLGLMGQGITKFRPYDNVTRSEFGTILSRLLWGDEYNGGNPYYKKHLNQLNIRGIMTSIKNAENLMELRGNVMVMLKRSESLGNYKTPNLEELNDDAFQCFICEPNNCGYDDELGKVVCNPGDCSYEGIPKKRFITPYKDGYIGYDWIDDGLGDSRLVITYRNLDNPCEIMKKTDNVFHYNYDNVYKIGCVIDYGYTRKKVETFNSEEKDTRKCMDNIEKYFYKLIIGQEQQEYFSKIMNNFKESIN